MEKRQNSELNLDDGKLKDKSAVELEVSHSLFIILPSSG